MKLLNKKGTVLLFVVVAMTAISVLGTGIYFMTTTATFSGLDANDLNRAYQLAVAGRDYALAKNLTDAEGGYFTFINGDKFHLVISGNDITSTGIVREGTPYEAKRTITTTKTGFGSQADISFAKDIQSFTSPVQSQAGFITPDTDKARITLGQIGMQSSFGSVWYQGEAIQGNCVGGKCDLGTGFRAFFIFQFGLESKGNGFTFAFFNGNGVDVNGISNDAHSVGGNSDMGELMGYAGDSRRIDSVGTSFLDAKGGRGIQPPKVAIEFDPHSNICSDCTCSVCGTDSRCDGSNDHMAYVFWGNSNPDCFDTIGKNTYDDNKHGIPSSSLLNLPQNASSPNSGGMDTKSYFDGTALLPSNWLKNFPTNIYAFRVEVTRLINADNNYNYIIKSWIVPCSDISCSTIPAGYDNTKVAYGVTPSVTPTLDRMIELDPTYNNNFNKFFFGWTAATGISTQNVNIDRFKMNFLK